MSEKGQRIHIYPFNPKTGETKHVIDTDYMCWCKPVNRQLCECADVNGKGEDGCWHCGGAGCIDVYDWDLTNLVVHINDEKKPCYPDERYPVIFGGHDHHHEPPAKPYKCPVCTGRGVMPFGFYNTETRGLIDWTKPAETCRTCDGEGIVWG